MTTEQICPIWGTWAEVKSADYQFKFDVDSPRAGGAYHIDVTAKKALNHADKALKARLTTWLLDQRKFGIDRPVVNQEAIATAEQAQPLLVHVRADRLLELCAKRTQKIGAPIRIGNLSSAATIYPAGAPSVDDREAYLYYAHTESTDHSEIKFLTNYLIEKRWIARPSNNLELLLVTVDGHSRLADLATKSVNSSQAFVAMWFDDSMNDAFVEGIEPGISDAGYKPVRIDRKEHNNKIDDEIIAEIRRSRFLVADFTCDENGARGGVYFEAGFAQGLNIPVIFSCRSDFIEKVHFDTRQYNHIVWAAPQELRLRLSQRISATIGDGAMRLTG